MNKYMNVVKKAIGRMNDDVTLIEAMADICEEEKIDIEKFAEWVKKYSSLKETVQLNSKKYRLLIDKKDDVSIVPLTEIF